MNTIDKVSVIIPSYNRMEFLKQAVKSVLDQTYRSLEIIVVDDGSTDETPNFIAGLSSPADIAIRYIRAGHCGKPGKVRNIGIRKASGNYIAFLDSDDLWVPVKIEEQISFFRENPDLSFCHTREIWKRGDKIISQSSQRHSRFGCIFRDSLKKCIIGPSTVMIKKELMEKSGLFREDLEIAEDYELWLRITSRFRIGYIDKPLVVKRGGHADQLSLKYSHIEIFRIQALLKNIGEGYFDEEQMGMVQEEMERKWRIYIQGRLKRMKLQGA